MSSITLPAGWSLYRQNGDVVTCEHTSHTADVPVLWIFKAQPPVNGALRYNHHIVIGTKDAGSDESRNFILDVTARNVPTQDQAFINARLLEILTAISTTGLEDMCVSGRIPN